MGSGWKGRRQPAVVAVLSGALVLMALAPVATAAAASKPAPKAPTTTTTTTIPAVAAVPLSVTDGQPAAALLKQAITLDSVGVDTTAVRAAVAATQQQLDQEAVSVRQLRVTATEAQQRATALLARAHGAALAYASLDSAVKQAVLFLYVNGPRTVTINPAAGDVLAYAIDYADTAITPTGVLATRSYDADSEQQALAAAQKAATAASRATKAAAAVAAAETAEDGRLLTELSAISAASASEVAADHAALASQAGAELRSTTSLQFTPKAAIPAPLATTDVALEWAFAELGKPYVWGATGPNSFDCSGLTQFVWRLAGVSIPRVAAAQYAWTIPVPLSQLLPGDLVFYGATDIHHVGIYIGDGLMINAPYTGTVVQVSSIWWSDLAGFGRVHATATPVPLHVPPSATRPATPAVLPAPGPVPSQTKPPAGWKPKPGSSTPFQVYPGPTTTVASTTTTTTTVPASTTTSIAPTTAASTTTTSTTTADSASTSTTSTSTTTTTSPPGGSQSP